MHGLSKLLRFLFQLLSSVALILFLPGFWQVFLIYGPILVAGAWHPLAIGGLAGALFELILLRRLPFIATLEHELTHALAGLPFGQIPCKLIVTNGRGGYCRTIGLTPAFLTPIASDFIVLAPYVLPTLTMIAVFVRPLLEPVWLSWFDPLIGMTLGYHVTSTLTELRENWSCKGGGTFVSEDLDDTDIGKAGRGYSLVYIPIVTMALHGLCLVVFLEGYAGSGRWAWLVWQTTRAFAAATLQGLY